MPSATLLPWFAPRLSPGIARVLTSIGHKIELVRGAQVVSSPFFKRVVFVRSGLLAQGVIHPVTNLPFMLTLSAAGSFGVMTRAIDAVDDLPRRYWAATRCELLTVVPEIFLRVAEIEPTWNEEINCYAVGRAFCERLGLMICQAATPQERLGVFLVSLVRAAGTPNIGALAAKSFVRLPSAPSRRLTAALLNCRLEQIDETLLGWMRAGLLRLSGSTLLVRTDLLHKYETWLQPFLRLQPDSEIRGTDRPSFDVSNLV